MINPYLGFLGIVVIGGIGAALKEEIRTRIAHRIHQLGQYFCPTDPEETSDIENQRDSIHTSQPQSFVRQTEMEINCLCFKYSKKGKSHLKANQQELTPVNPTLIQVSLDDEAPPPLTTVSPNEEADARAVLGHLVIQHLAKKRLEKQKKALAEAKQLEEQQRSIEEANEEDDQVEAKVDQVIHGQLHSVGHPNRPAPIEVEESQIYFDTVGSPRVPASEIVRVWSEDQDLSPIVITPSEEPHRHTPVVEFVMSAVGIAGDLLNAATLSDIPFEEYGNHQLLREFSARHVEATASEGYPHATIISRLLAMGVVGFAAFVAPDYDSF